MTASTGSIGSMPKVFIPLELQYSPNPIFVSSGKNFKHRLTLSRYYGMDELSLLC